ncbi:hypothetical protein ACS0TY_019067 [Phlomoides rotata]
MLLKGMEFDTTHFITDVSGKYPRLWALKGAHPVTVNRWYKFGVLASIRTITPGFREISELPDWVGRKRIKVVLGIAEGIQDYGITCCGCVIEVCGASSPYKTRWIRPGSTSVKTWLGVKTALSPNPSKNILQFSRLNSKRDERENILCLCLGVHGLDVVEK